MKKILLFLTIFCTLFSAVNAQNDATISADEVTYWVGEGSNEVLVAITWCSNTAAAFAWGYRFDGDATVFDALSAIAEADSRLTVVGMAPTNITYVDGEYDLTMCPNPDAQWGDDDYDVPMHSINGMTGQTSMSGDAIHNNDFIKIGGYACAEMSSDWTTIAWGTPIVPAVNPNEVGPSEDTFDGVVLSEGCQAIHYDDPAILGWATACTIERGPRNIAAPGGIVAFGSEDDAVGPASANTAAVVSLGDGGTAVLTFDIPIQNGDGYDFAVFENALNNTFLELAFVEVSSDGVNYVRFPAISNTPTDVQVLDGGSVDATLIYNLAGKYAAGWGTPFDLEEIADDPAIDVNNITHVRVVDVVGSVNPRYATRDSRGHIINDPYPTDHNTSGFDLDGVCVLNGWRPNSVADYEVPNTTFKIYPNPCQSAVNCETEIGQPVVIYNAMGAVVYCVIATETLTVISVNDLPAGMYIIQQGAKTAKMIKR
ncbi:MAG: T9SS type A sorting domain-containing protein [Bacteroidales bacterium]|nr:T9SS type A sorting domain-containing protein [Bacteroidales bacterium]